MRTAPPRWNEAEAQRLRQFSDPGFGKLQASHSRWYRARDAAVTAWARLLDRLAAMRLIRRRQSVTKR